MFDRIDIFLDHALCELLTKGALRCLQQFMGFVDHHIRASLHDAAGRIDIRCLEAGEEEIMIGHLKIDEPFSLAVFT